MSDEDTIRRLIGHDVDVARRDGHHQRGRLVNVNRRSLWLVDDADQDRFIARADVSELRAAS